MQEYKCTQCGETFVETLDDNEETAPHFNKEDGTPCEGMGRAIGTWS